MTKLERVNRQHIEAKNRELYDNAANDLWRLLVYEPVHEGWEFTNIGGRGFLDLVGRHAGRGGIVAELCSGCGDCCRYLAEHFECRVTGVEMNPNQVQHARRKLATLPPEVRSRMDFVEADVTRWRASQSYKVVYMMDSLMLMLQPAEAIRKAFDCLRPGGVFLAAEVTAGRQLSDELRRYAWEVDGMASLLPPEEYEAILCSAGFSGVSVKDDTEAGARCFETIRKAIERWEARLRKRGGRKVFDSWVDVADVYRHAFRERRLLYTRFVGRRPASGPEIPAAATSGLAVTARLGRRNSRAPDAVEDNLVDSRSMTGDDRRCRGFQEI